MLNNINGNNFGTFNEFKKNAMKINDYFWNLNMDLKKYYICSI